MSSKQNNYNDSAYNRRQKGGRIMLTKTKD